MSSSSTDTSNASPSFSTGSGPGPRLMTADTLTGDKVINLQDETLGKISDIMLDVPRGRIAYAVMSSGGFLGMGEKMFALPWSALTLDPQRECFVMDASKARFDNAPGFDPDHWPSSAEFDTLGEEIHTYWNSARYWD
ncbi:MAG: PRC-barrel domain containing protein [Rubrivivax sp.]|nr:MAG: PRC-barrel domain containing protein [Rubrivivax sp.]